jgi:eukaryotic-like serine/threonine-protein kinase
MAVLSGTLLGPYEVLAPLGSGGMGEVYRARDTRLGREVAVKVLPASLAGDEDRLRRFELEARSAGALNHPNIVTVLDIGAHDGVPYLVEELLEGETLRERLSEGALPTRKAVDIGRQVARGLAAAHDKGIVHRDLKPENIFLTRTGQAKILDFGLAKVGGRAGSDPGVTMVPPAGAAETTPGVMLGTVGYMSPEQVRGQAADHRSDIFALGAVLYEMLSGRKAFAGDSGVETLSAILKADPLEVTASGVALNPSLDRVIGRCLEKQPDERFQSARDLSFALEAASEASGLHPAPDTVEARPRRRLVPLLALAGAVLAVLLATDVFLRLRAKPATAAGGIAVHFTRLTDQPGVESFPALSPDGKTIAYSAMRGGQPDIFVQRVGGHKPVDLTPDSPVDDTRPAFSQDGERIAFRSERDGGGIFVMGATGEAVRRLTDFGYDPSWSPDGRSLVIATEGVKDPLSRNGVSALWLVDAASGAKKLLYKGDAVQPRWSPHAERIAFWALPPGSSQRDVWTIPAKGLAEGGRPIAVTSDKAVDWNPVWSPDGRFLYFGSDRGGSFNLWRVAIQETSGAIQGTPQPVTTPASWSGYFSISADGRQIAFDSLTYSTPLERLDIDLATGTARGKPTVLLETLRSFEGGSISPDGSSIALRTTDSHEDLFVLHADGSGMRQLTDDAFRNRGPSWSADGRSIAFYSDRSGQYAAWSLGADGSDLRQLTETGECYWFPIWSPDGRSAALTGPQAGCLRHASTPGGALGDEEPLPKQGEASFWPQSWSADGRRLSGILTQNEDDLGKVAVYDIASKSYSLPGPLAVAARFLESQRLVTLRDGKLYVVDLRNGHETVLLDSPSDRPVSDFRVAPGGGWISLLPGIAQADVWQAELQ